MEIKVEYLVHDIKENFSTDEYVDTVLGRFDSREEANAFVMKRIGEFVVVNFGTPRMHKVSVKWLLETVHTVEYAKLGKNRYRYFVQAKEVI